MAKLVSKTYGDALFALAVEEHMVDQLYEEAVSYTHLDVYKRQCKEQAAGR